MFTCDKSFILRARVGSLHAETSEQLDWSDVRSSASVNMRRKLGVRRRVHLLWLPFSAAQRDLAKVRLATECIAARTSREGRQKIDLMEEGRFGRSRRYGGAVSGPESQAWNDMLREL